MRRCKYNTLGVLSLKPASVAVISPKPRGHFWKKTSREEQGGRVSRWGPQACGPLWPFSEGLLRNAIRDGPATVLRERDGPRFWTHSVNSTFFRSRRRALIGQWISSITYTITSLQIIGLGANSTQ